jgi:hypothetical protein
MPSELRLLKKIVCPYCWTEFAPQDVLWLSEHEELRGDFRLGEEEFQRFLPTRFNVRGNALDARGTVCHELACPHCHLGLPRDLLETPVFFMSIFGSPSSGKTVYLASLTHRLRQVLPLDFKVGFADTTPEGNVRIRRNESTLFDNPDPNTPVNMGEAIKKTLVIGSETGIDLLNVVNFGGNDNRYFPQPFLFTLQVLDQHPVIETRNDQGRVLCLYDNSGESFDPTVSKELELQTRHLSRSQLLLFTFDPTQDPRMKQKIMEKSPDRLLRKGAMIAQEPFFQTAAARIKKFAGLGRRDRHKAPLVIAVTKFDVWSDVIGEFDRSAVPWRQVRVASSNGEDSGVAMAIDQGMIGEMSDQVRRLLVQTNPEIVTAAENLSEDVVYVPVSALGWNNATVKYTDAKGNDSENYQVRPADIQPFWAEVPVLYGMSRAMPKLLPVLKAN